MADQRRIEDLKRRVQQDPASIAFAALADEYRRAGYFREAVETCRAGLQRHPAYLSARVTLGRALLELGELDEAEAELDQVVRAAPENLAAIRALADIHRRRGDAPPEPPAPDKPLAMPSTPTDNVRTDDVPATRVTPPPSQAEAGPQAVRPAVQEQKPQPQPAAAVPPPPAPALRLASVAQPAATPVEAVPVPRVDPAIARLEAFLAAIERARRELRAGSST